MKEGDEEIVAVKRACPDLTVRVPEQGPRRIQSPRVSQGSRAGESKNVCIVKRGLKAGRFLALARTKSSGGKTADEEDGNDSNGAGSSLDGDWSFVMKVALQRTRPVVLKSPSSCGWAQQQALAAAKQ